MITEAMVRRLSEARMRSYDPILPTWQPPDEVRQRFASEIRELLRRVGDESFGRALLQHFPQPGIENPSEYQDAVLWMPDGSLALTGIRWRGGDPEKPFVDVPVLEGAADSAERLRMVVDTIHERWRRFAPTRMRLAFPSSGMLPVAGFDQETPVDLHLIAGRVGDMLANRKAPTAGLAIRPATNMSWYETYRRAYVSFLGAAPERKDWVQPESCAAMESAVQQSAVYLVEHAGEIAGVYALPCASAHGLRGFRVQEKFLFERLRGTGVGARVEQMVIGCLPARPDDVVFGSIEAGNTPSLRTARNVGRVEIGALVWVELSGTDQSGMRIRSARSRS